MSNFDDDENERERNKRAADEAAEKAKQNDDGTIGPRDE